MSHYSLSRGYDSLGESRKSSVVNFVANARMRVGTDVLGKLLVGELVPVSLAMLAHEFEQMRHGVMPEFGAGNGMDVAKCPAGRDEVWISNR